MGTINVITDFYKEHPLVSISTGSFLLVLKHDAQIFCKRFWILLSLHKLFSKELRINYVPETRNGCDLMDQTFRSYNAEAVGSLDPDKWGYMLAKSVATLGTTVLDIIEFPA